MNEIVIIVTLFSVWWSGNALYALDAQSLLKNSPQEYLIFDLAFVQILFGLISSHLLYIIGKRSDRQDTLPSHPLAHYLSWKNIRTVSAPFFISGACNYIGTAMTNRSYQVIGSTSTLVWKLSEPLSVVVLKIIILDEMTSLSAIIGVLQVIIGVLYFISFENGFKLALSTPIVVSNFVFPLRNVLVKLDQKINTTNGRNRSSLETYRLLMLVSTPLSLLGVIHSVLSRRSFIPIGFLGRLIKNAILFNSYQLASISLLTRLDPLTHAVSNTLKRFSAIVISIVLGKEFLAGERSLALLLTVIGFIVYTSSSKIFANKASNVRTVQLISSIIYISVCMQLIPSYTSTKSMITKYGQN